MTQECSQRVLRKADRTESKKPLMLAWALLVFIFAYSLVCISIGLVGLMGHLNSINLSPFFAAVASAAPHGTAWLLTIVGLLFTSCSYGLATLMLSERRNRDAGKSSDEAVFPVREISVKEGGNENEDSK